eukprot:752418-Hanusia_phi.AAC.3
MASWRAAGGEADQFPLNVKLACSTCRGGDVGGEVTAGLQVRRGWSRRIDRKAESRSVKQEEGRDLESARWRRERKLAVSVPGISTACTRVVAARGFFIPLSGSCWEGEDSLRSDAGVAGEGANEWTRTAVAASTRGRRNIILDATPASMPLVPPHLLPLPCPSLLESTITNTPACQANPLLSQPYFAPLSCPLVLFNIFLFSNLPLFLFLTLHFHCYPSAHIRVIFSVF